MRSCAYSAAVSLLVLLTPRGGAAQSGETTTEAPAFGEAPPGAQPEDATGSATAGDAARADATKEASQRFQRGLELYREGDYALALIEFTRAYELIPNYRVLYNIGQVSIQLNRYARARTALEQYLAEGGAEVPEARRAEVVADIEMLKRRTALITIGTNQAGAEILVDEVPVGESPLSGSLMVDAGEHRVSVRKAGFRSRPKQVVLAGGDSARVTLELTRDEAEPTIVYERRVESQIVEKAPGTRRAWLIVGWSTTGLLATGAVVTGIVGISTVADLRDELRTETTRKELDEYKNRGRTLLAVSDGLTVAALAFGGISLYATLRAASRNPKVTRSPPGVGTFAPASRAQPKTTLNLHIGPRSVVVGGTF